MYDRRLHRKRTRTFATRDEARAWRVHQLRRMYPSVTKRGRADTAYGYLRRAITQLDGAIPSLDERGRIAARATLASLYEAEDRFLTVLGSTEAT